MPRQQVISLLLALLWIGGAVIAQSWFLGGGATAAALADAGDKLRNVPAEFAGWESVDFEISRPELELAQIDAYVSRRYTQQSTGATVTLLLVCGRPGPISVHTPDVCFQGAGFRLLSDPELATIADVDDHPRGEFRVGDFAAANVSGGAGVRARWAWSSGQNWSAPSDPRLTFAGQPYLYKLYVVGPRNLLGENATDPGLTFLQELLPHLQPVLQPASATP